LSKPKGRAYETFCKSWEQADHEGKIALCESNNVTYETGRHHYSDAPSEYKTRKSKPMRMTVDDILESRPAVNLDFCSFDLESSNLNADFSIMLAACIKPYGQDVIVFRADEYPEWQSNRADDSKITKDIAQELRKHAIIIGHYSQKFDIPFLRAKMLRHGLEPLPPMFGIDTWRVAKNNFKVSSRRLKNLATYFDVGEKEGVEGALWMDAAYNGSKEAMDKIIKHNIIDVEVLEKLACLTFPYIRSIPKL